MDLLAKNVIETHHDPSAATGAVQGIERIRQVGARVMRHNLARPPYVPEQGRTPGVVENLTNQQSQRHFPTWIARSRFISDSRLGSRACYTAPTDLLYEPGSKIVPNTQPIPPVISNPRLARPLPALSHSFGRIESLSKADR